MAHQKTRLLLVRHGEVDANLAYRYLGRRDDPLNDRGREQARLVADTLAGIRADRLISSPLDRTLATAGEIAAATGLEVERDRRLIEMDFGEWEGRTRQQVADVGGESLDLLKRWEGDPTVSPPSGESLTEVRSRVLSWMGETGDNAAGSTVIMVSHMGPIKVVLCEALGLGLEATRRIFLDPATISVVDWGESPVVRLINSHAHLGFGNARWMRR